MAQFTPGPWEADKHAISVTAANFCMKICDIRGWGYLTGTGGLNLPENQAFAIQEANARLISAAPELLQALEGLKLECLADPRNPCLLGWKIGKPVQHWGSTPEKPVAACSSCVARAAVAKAKGGPA